MKAVIFCAGKGTRLKSLSKNMPKQLIELQGKTVLEHIFDLLKRHNIKEVVLVVCHLKEQIKAYYEDGKKFGLKINYIEEEKLLGTANHLNLAKNYLYDLQIVPSISFLN